jgi:hypothetical protein
MEREGPDASPFLGRTQHATGSTLGAQSRGAIFGAAASRYAVASKGEGEEIPFASLEGRPRTRSACAELNGSESYM